MALVSSGSPVAAQERLGVMGDLLRDVMVLETKIISELAKSFDFLKRAMSDTPDGALELPPRNSMRKTTTRATWIAAVTHLHEHLGQLIAYARSNGITRPWSR